MSDDKFADYYKTWHTYVSYAKSGIRIIGCVATLLLLGYNNVVPGIVFLATSFLVAEIFGIAEEWI